MTTRQAVEAIRSLGESAELSGDYDLSDMCESLAGLVLADRETEDALPAEMVSAEYVRALDQASNSYRGSVFMGRRVVALAVNIRW